MCGSNPVDVIRRELLKAYRNNFAFADTFNRSL